MIYNRLNDLLHQIDLYKDSLIHKEILNKEEGEGKKPFPLLKRLFFHPKDRITICFLVLPDRVLSIYSGFLMLNYSCSTLTRIHLRELVKNWHYSFQSFSGRSIKTNYQEDKRALETTNKNISEELSAHLHLKKILDKLPARIRKISFIPDDVLHGLPFSAIHYKDNFLIKNYALSIQYESKTVFIKSLNKNRPKKALLVGISKGMGGLSALAGVPLEIEEVQKILEANKFEISASLLNESAVKEKILSVVKDCTLFHIACHGTFNFKSPAKTGMFLLNNEILSLKDIFISQAFQNVDQVTLSSCWAADHFILPGRKIISLPETFWRGGVNTIAGCLWKVGDRASVSFMKKFYEYANKYPKDEALRRTKIDTMENKLPNCDENTSNIFYWAGYNIYGNV